MDCLKQAFALFDRDRDGEINKESSDELNSVNNKSYLWTNAVASVSQYPNYFDSLQPNISLAL